MNSVTDSLLKRAFGRPKGTLGRLGGALMVRGNTATELQVVRLARLGPEDVVLVVGHGPGVGLRAAAGSARRAIGIDPSPEMREAAARRCAGRPVEIRDGTAEATGLPDGAVNAVLSVNNAQLWDDLDKGLAELRRVLSPGGELLLSTHARWFPGGQAALTAGAREAGFTDVQAWTWQPPRGASLALQLRAYRPD